MMKNLFCFALVASALAACSESEEKDPFVVCPVEHVETISFESSEGMVDFLGEPVRLGSIEMVGGSAGGRYDRVFCACLPAYADYMEQGTPNEVGWFSTYFDGPLFSTADNDIWFGSYYSDNAVYGSRMDSNYGFMLTSNYDRTASELNYADQFKVWAAGGALNSENCAIGYYSEWGGVYGVPTIEFIRPRQVCHCYLANTAITMTYVPMEVDAAAFEYKIVVSGWLEGEQTGSVECVLIDGRDKVQDWTFVDLSALGKVDQLKFRAVSNDVGAYGDNAPTYFALDEIGITVE